jgi:hypothetical protein
MMAGVGVGVARCGRRGATTGVGRGLAFVFVLRVCAPAATMKGRVTAASTNVNRNLLAASGNRNTV